MAGIGDYFKKKSNSKKDSLLFDTSETNFDDPESELLISEDDYSISVENISKNRRNPKYFLKYFLFYPIIFLLLAWMSYFTYGLLTLGKTHIDIKSIEIKDWCSDITPAEFTFKIKNPGRMNFEVHEFPVYLYFSNTDFNGIVPDVDPDLEGLFPNYKLDTYSLTGEIEQKVLINGNWKSDDVLSKFLNDFFDHKPIYILVEAKHAKIRKSGLTLTHTFIFEFNINVKEGSGYDPIHIAGINFPLHSSNDDEYLPVNLALDILLREADVILLDNLPDTKLVGRAPWYPDLLVGGEASYPDQVNERGRIFINLEVPKNNFKSGYEFLKYTFFEKDGENTNKRREVNIRGDPSYKNSKCMVHRVVSEFSMNLYLHKDDGIPGDGFGDPLQIGNVVTDHESFNVTYVGLNDIWPWYFYGQHMPKIRLTTDLLLKEDMNEKNIISDIAETLLDFKLWAAPAPLPPDGGLDPPKERDVFIVDISFRNIDPGTVGDFVNLLFESGTFDIIKGLRVGYKGCYDCHPLASDFFESFGYYFDLSDIDGGGKTTSLESLVANDDGEVSVSFSLNLDSDYYPVNLILPRLVVQAFAGDSPDQAKSIGTLSLSDLIIRTVKSGKGGKYFLEPDFQFRISEDERKVLGKHLSTITQNREQTKTFFRGAPADSKDNMFQKILATCSHVFVIDPSGPAQKSSLKKVDSIKDNLSFVWPLQITNVSANLMKEDGFDFVVSIHIAIDTIRRIGFQVPEIKIGVAGTDTTKTIGHVSLPASTVDIRRYPGQKDIYIDIPLFIRVDNIEIENMALVIDNALIGKDQNITIKGTKGSGIIQNIAENWNVKFLFPGIPEFFTFANFNITNSENPFGGKKIQNKLGDSEAYITIEEMITLGGGKGFLRYGVGLNFNFGVFLVGTLPRLQFHGYSGDKTEKNSINIIEFEPISFIYDPEQNHQSFYFVFRYIMDTNQAKVFSDTLIGLGQGKTASILLLGSPVDPKKSVSMLEKVVSKVSHTLTIKSNKEPQPDFYRSQALKLITEDPDNHSIFPDFNVTLLSSDQNSLSVLLQRELFWSAPTSHFGTNKANVVFENQVIASLENVGDFTEGKPSNISLKFNLSGTKKSRTALENFVASFTSGQNTINLLLELTSTPAKGQDTAKFSIPITLPIGASGASKDTGNSIIPCVTMMHFSLNTTQIIKAKCAFTVDVAIYAINPTPLKIVLDTVDMKVKYDNQEGALCIAGHCAFPPKNGSLLTDVHEPNPDNVYNKLPLNLEPNKEVYTAVELTNTKLDDPNQVCFRIASQYISNYLDIHIEDGVAALTVEKMKLNVRFRLDTHIEFRGKTAVDDCTPHDPVLGYRPPITVTVNIDGEGFGGINQMDKMRKIQKS